MNADYLPASLQPIADVGDRSDERSMKRVTNLVLAGTAALASSCDRPAIPIKLADGCYYAKEKPVFKILGRDGQVLIPGEVQAFKVSVGKDGSGAYAIFAPGFFFDVDAYGVPQSADIDPDRKPFRQSLNLERQPPTIEMNWTAYGHEEVTWGQSC